jgi:Peptidase of plants and bacteria
MTSQHRNIALLWSLLLMATISRPVAAQDVPPKPVSVTIEGDVDAELAPVAGQLTTLFYQGYPKLLARFDNPAKPAPRNLRIVFVKDLRVPAQCSGNKIEVSTDWLRKHPNDTALLTHEMTHAVQQYPRGAPGWMVEGIADYARQVYGPKDQADWSLPKKLTAKMSYKDSYRTTARFLVWLEARTPGAIDKLHRNMQDKSFTIEDFQTIAGRPIDALWDECRAELNK